MSIKTLLGAAVVAIAATTATAGPLEDAEQLGKCKGYAHQLLTNFEVDIMLQDKWTAEELGHMADYATTLYSQKLVPSVTEGLSKEKTYAVKDRLYQRFNYGKSFAYGFVGGQGLNRATDFMLDGCKSYLKNSPLALLP